MKKERKTTSLIFKASFVLYIILVLNSQILTETLGESLLLCLENLSIAVLFITIARKALRETRPGDFTVEQARHWQAERIPRWLPLAVIGIVLIIGSKNISPGFFTRDDCMKLLHVRFGASPIRDLTRLYTTINYRPIEFLPWYMDYAVWGTKPEGYYVTNLLLHIANCLLAFFLFRRILPKQSQQVFATLLLAAHPTCTRLSLYVAQRHTLFAAVFVLAIPIIYDGYLRTGSRVRYRVALALYLFGIFSRESVGCVPLLLVLWEAFFCGKDLLQDREQRKRALIALAPFFIVTILFFAWRYHILGDWGRVIDNPKMSVFRSLRVFLFAMPREFFVPIERLIGYHVLNAQVVLALISLITLIMLLLRSRSFQPADSRAILFSMGWIILSALPTLNLVGWFSTIIPSYIHLPTIGICMLMGVLWDPGKGKAASIEKVCCILFFLFFFLTSLLIARSYRKWWYPPIRKASIESLVRFVEENHADSPPGTVFLIKDLPREHLRFRHDYSVKTIAPRPFLDYLFLPVVSDEDAKKWQEDTNVILPEILRDQLWVNYDEIHPYSDNPTNRSRGDVEGYLPLCGDGEVDNDGDGVTDNIYVFKDLGDGCRPMGEDFYRIYRFIRSPHWDLHYRRIWLKVPSFSDVKGKTWTTVYLQYLTGGSFREVSEARFFEAR